jgi:hypothetical protein
MEFAGSFFIRHWLRVCANRRVWDELWATVVDGAPLCGDTYPPRRLGAFLSHINSLAFGIHSRSPTLSEVVVNRPKAAISLLSGVRKQELGELVATTRRIPVA